jgi:chloramphenicol-sensitive protein RarD
MDSGMRRGIRGAMPLIAFSYAVRGTPLPTVGLMRRIAPALQFLTGALIFQEAFDRDRAIGFVFLWIALAVFAIDGLRRARSTLQASKAPA